DVCSSDLKQLFVSEHFLTPRIAIEGLQLVEPLFGKLEPAPLDVFIVRHPANRSFLGERAAMRAIDNPFQHPHVFAEARPNKVSLVIFAEPVDMKDTRGFCE